MSINGLFGTIRPTAHQHDKGRGDTVRTVAIRSQPVQHALTRGPRERKYGPRPRRRPLKTALDRPRGDGRAVDAPCTPTPRRRVGDMSQLIKNTIIPEAQGIPHVKETSTPGHGTGLANYGTATISRPTITTGGQ